MTARDKGRVSVHSQHWFRVWIPANVCRVAEAFSATVNNLISDVECYSSRISQRLAVARRTDPREIFTPTPTRRLTLFLLGSILPALLKMVRAVESTLGLLPGGTDPREIDMHANWACLLPQRLLDHQHSQGDAERTAFRAFNFETWSL